MMKKTALLLVCLLSVLAVDAEGVVVVSRKISSVNPPWTFEATGCTADDWGASNSQCNCDTTSPAGPLTGSHIAAVDGNKGKRCTSNIITFPVTTFCVTIYLYNETSLPDDGKFLFAMLGSAAQLFTLEMNDASPPKWVLTTNSGSGHTSGTTLAVDTWYKHEITFDPTVPGVVSNGWMIDDGSAESFSASASTSNTSTRLQMRSRTDDLQGIDVIDVQSGACT